MNVIATYNLKGGVGKTATTVNLAYLAANEGLRTLVWDLDAQGATSFYFRIRPKVASSEDLLGDKNSLVRALRATDYDGLDLIPANYQYRHLDIELGAQKKPHARLKRLLKAVKDEYDLVFLDCAPSMSLVSENLFRMARIWLVPLVPTHLSLRAYDQVLHFNASHEPPRPRLLPFFSMVDRRKRLHREVVADFATAHPEVLRSYIPYSTHIEQMGTHRAPVNAFADTAAGGRAFRALWQTLKSKL